MTEFNIHKVNNYARLANSIILNQDERKMNNNNLNQNQNLNVVESQAKKKKIAPTLIDTKTYVNNNTLLLNENTSFQGNLGLGGLNQMHGQAQNFNSSQISNFNSTLLNNRGNNDSRLNFNQSSLLDGNLLTQILLNLNKSVDALTYLGKKKDKEALNSLQQVENFNLISLKEEKEFKPYLNNINFNKQVYNFENYSLPKDLILITQNFYNSTAKIEMFYGKIPLFIINTNENIIKFAYNSIFFAYYCIQSGLTVKTLFNTTIFNKIKVSHIEKMKCYKYHLCIIENDTFKIFNILSKKIVKVIQLHLNADNKIIDFEYIDNNKIYIKYVKTDIKFRKDNTCWLIYNDTINQFTTIQDSICDFDEFFKSIKESDLIKFNQNNEKIKELLNDKDENSFFIEDGNLEINYQDNPYLVFFCNKNFKELLETITFDDKVNTNINDSNHKQENDKKNKKNSRKDLVYYQKIEVLTCDLQSLYDRFEFYKSLKNTEKSTEIMEDIFDFFLNNKIMSYSGLDFLIWSSMSQKFQSESYFSKEKSEKLFEYFEKGKYLEKRKDVLFVTTILHFLTTDQVKMNK